MTDTTKISRFLHSQLLLALAAVATAAGAAWLYTLGGGGAAGADGADVSRGIVLPSANLWLTNPAVSAAVNVAVTIAMAAFMGLLNRRYNLQRTATALDSTFFLTMSLSATPLLLHLGTGTVLGVVVLLCLYLLYGSYGDGGATRHVFLVFLLLSAMTMTQYCYIVYIPVFMAGIIQMRILSWRMAAAMFLGLITPWWLLGGVAMLMPVTISFPDVTQVFTAFSVQQNAGLIATAALAALLLFVAWVGYFPQMIAYNAHKRAYNGTFTLLALMTVIAAAADISNIAVYTPVLFLCASLQLGRLFGGRPTAPGNVAVITLLTIFILIFLWHPLSLILL